MSWCKIIKTNKKVLEEDIDKIVDGVPDNLRLFPKGIKIKQSWGWSLMNDLSINDKDVIIEGSSSISPDVISPYIRSKLEEFGYTIESVDQYE